MFFNPGDEISLNSIVIDGYITSSKTRIVISIPVGKRLDLISSAKTSLATGILRQNGNYLVGGTEESHGFTMTTLSPSTDLILQA